MELIDRNKLKPDYIVAATSTNVPCYRYYSKEQIDNAPTVDAIPIEWIKKQVKDGWYDIIEIMYHWEIENNIKKSILWSEENESRDTESIK